MIELAVETGKPRSAASVLADIQAGDRAMTGPVIFQTGFSPFDRAIGGGLRGGDLVLVGGGPGVGKTITSLQWARNLADSGTPCVFACYEHDHASLLARLLLSEVGSRADGVPRTEIRELVRSIAAGDRKLGESTPSGEVVRAAAGRLATYADNLWLVQASSAHTGIPRLEEIVRQYPAGEAVLFVDYLQKVSWQGASDESRRVAKITEGLKEVALRHGIPVVAVVAGDRVGLNARRLRMHHMRGSSALAYEADVVVMLNDKFRAVSNVHTAYDPVRAETFKSEVIFTIEKNRDGPAPVELEFRKDFGHYRFDPDGGYVSERLVDDQFYAE